MIEIINNFCMVSMIGQALKNYIQVIDDEVKNKSSIALRCYS